MSKTERTADPRDEAEALAVALTYGLCKVSPVIAWADAQIMGQDHPSVELCDLSLAGKMYPLDVASLLRQLHTGFSKSVVSGLLADLMNEIVKKDRSLARSIATTLSSLASIEVIEEKSSTELSSWVDDALDFADENYVLLTNEEIEAQIVTALDNASKLNTIRWSQAVW